MPQSIGHWLTIAERRAQNVAFKWRSKAPPPNGTIPGQNTYEVDAGRAGRNKADCVVQEDASKEGRAHRVTPTLPLNPAKEHWVGWWIKVTGLPLMYWNYMLKGHVWFPKHNTAFKGDVA